MSEVESGSICRDEHCDRMGVHPWHPMGANREVKPHHRPGKKPVWQLDDPTALTGAVARATSKAYPTHFAAIVRDVRDDYGTVTERTVYRHIKKLVARGHIAKVDIGFAFAAYIRPGSRMFKTADAIRDYILGTVEMTACTREVG